MSPPKIGAQIPVIVAPGDWFSRVQDNVPVVWIATVVDVLDNVRFNWRSGSGMSGTCKTADEGLTWSREWDAESVRALLAAYSLRTV